MATDKRFVCLANSRKLHGSCIAGKELVADRPGGWIRPIGTHEHEGVSIQEQEFQDGSVPALLDIIDISLVEARPREFQRENWLLDPGFYWIKAGTYPRSKIRSLCDSHQKIWINGFSTHDGLNDQIPLWRARELDTSLMLIHVDEVMLNVQTYDGSYGRTRRRVQGQFCYNGIEYKLWVTDPIIEAKYFRMPNGRYPLNHCLLTISLCEPFNNACYKLIAAVLHDEEQQ